jgi:hypothetical protein
MAERGKLMATRARESTSSPDVTLLMQALAVHQEILDELPVAVLGIGLDGVLALMNKEFMREFPELACVPLGVHIRKVFPPQMVGLVEEFLHSEQTTVLPALVIGSRCVTVRIAPLRGRWGQRGCVLVFCPAPAERGSGLNTTPGN